MGNINRTAGLIAAALPRACGLIVSRRSVGMTRGGMTRGRIVAAALAGVLAALMVTAGADAGSSAYDLNPMLDEQHPYARGIPPSQAAKSSRAAASAPQIAAEGAPRVKNGDPSFITISGGWYDFNDNEQAAEFTAEYRSGQMFWIFKPFAGAMFTSDAAVYGFGGFLSDFYFGRRIVVTPSIAAGLYADGDGKDLGSTIEFRSGLEIGWRFDNRSRLGAAIYHISNASISDNNPGTEILSIGYSFPLE